MLTIIKKVYFLGDSVELVKSFDKNGYMISLKIQMHL